MKKLILALAIGLGAFAANAQAQSLTKQEVQSDFNTIAKGKPGSHDRIMTAVITACASSETPVNINVSGTTFRKGTVKNYLITLEVMAGKKNVIVDRLEVSAGKITAIWVREQYTTPDSPVVIY